MIIVLKDASRQFPVIKEKAQEYLRDVFGMELVELMPKEHKKPTSKKGFSSIFLFKSRIAAKEEGNIWKLCTGVFALKERKRNLY